MSFVHLRTHTQYSLLEGAMHVSDMVARAKEMGMSAIAITDTNNLFGAIDFYEEARSAGIRPIIGCELRYSPQGRSITDPKSLKLYPLTVLCKNLKGYQNLCQMITKAYLDSAPKELEEGEKKKKGAVDYKVFITRELLDQWGDDLVVIAGDLKSEIGFSLLTGDEANAVAAIKWFHKRFKDDFYLEIVDSQIPEQDNINAQLAGHSEKMGIELVGTSNAHYLKPELGEAHEVLMCIEQGRNLDFDRPKSLVPYEFYLKSSELMKERLERFQRAYENTSVIADKCKVEFKFKDEKGHPIYHLPQFRPDGIAANAKFDAVEFFRQEARKGLLGRFAELGFVRKVTAPNWETLKPEYEKRLENELEMIIRTGFSGYFLVVADFINWAKNHGVPVGPGRGSGAGSLVAYSLRITDIDPIEFNLLFERFINPERISMPDFDVDFCQERRGEVIQYVTQKYGKENVCQIITFGKLQTRAVIRDVCRVMGLSFADSDILTKLVPDELGIALKDAIDKEPKIREKIDTDPKIEKVFEYALALEGLYRNAGIHAAGVIITEKPLVNYCPLYVGKDGDTVTQFDKDFAEKIGLVKFDFLGLKTLTVIDQAVKLVIAGAAPGSKEEKFNIENIDYFDPKVFALVSSGDTDGVFQVESSGMKDLCSRIQPGNLEDITAINALYRPGPLGSGMVDDFIDRKHGRKPIVYDVPALENILKETYGVILYQEQVMQIARELAGYSLGQADLLRRAMGKKKAEEMAQHREIFTTGAVKQGLDPAKAGGIFDLMAKFAEYGFNKSHSAAYGMITYQTAYLKAHYPAEFMAALMTTEMDNTDKITKYIGDARAHAIQVLPPDVNFSQKRFSVETLEDGKKAIRFGLEAIKGVGGIAVDLILEARKDGLFESVLNFCRRVSTRKVNKKVVEALTLAGGFDRISEVNRASLFASIDAVLEHAGDEQEERELGQTSLFDQFQAKEVKMLTPVNMIFKQETDWPISRKLALEKQTVGFYVSGHPMDPWQKLSEEWLGWNTAIIKKRIEEKSLPESKAPQKGDWAGGRYRVQRPEAKLTGLITELREVMTKKGTRMAFGAIEDLHGKIEVVFFPEPYALAQEMLKQSAAEAEPVVLTGELEASEETPKIFAKTLEWAKDLHQTKVQHLVLKLAPSKVTSNQLRELKKNLLEARGKCPVRIEFVDARFKARLQLPQTASIDPTPQVISSINRIFGSDVVSVLR